MEITQAFLDDALKNFDREKSFGSWVKEHQWLTQCRQILIRAEKSGPLSIWEQSKLISIVFDYNTLDFDKTAERYKKSASTRFLSAVRSQLLSHVPSEFQKAAHQALFDASERGLLAEGGLLAYVSFHLLILNHIVMSYGRFPSDKEEALVKMKLLHSLIEKTLFYPGCLHRLAEMVVFACSKEEPYQIRFLLEQLGKLLDRFPEEREHNITCLHTVIMPPIASMYTDYWFSLYQCARHESLRLVVEDDCLQHEDRPTVALNNSNTFWNTPAVVATSSMSLQDIVPNT